MQLNAVSRRMQTMQKMHVQLKCSCPPNAKNAYAAEKCSCLSDTLECRKCRCSLECTIMRSNAMICVTTYAKNVHGQKPHAFLGKNHNTPRTGAASDGRVRDLLSGREPAGRPAMARPAPSRRVLVGPCLVGGAGEVSGPGSRICASPAVVVWG